MRLNGDNNDNEGHNGEAIECINMESNESR